MPTVKPRIAITLEPEQHEVLARLAALQGRPMSRVVAELVAEFTPVLARVVGTMEAAVHAQASVRANIRKAVDEAEASILPHAEAVLRQYERFEGDLRQLTLQIGEVGMRQDEDGAAGATDSAPARAAAVAVSGPSAIAKDPRPVTTGVTNPERTAKPPRKPSGRRKPTRDEQAGIDWWNGLSKAARGRWLASAGSAVPGDAWAHFKASQTAQGASKRGLHTKRDR